MQCYEANEYQGICFFAFKSFTLAVLNNSNSTSVSNSIYICESFNTYVSVCSYIISCEEIHEAF